MPVRSHLRNREGNTMKVTLKKIEEQVIVITGASSGIGLATAKRAAAQGARVVLAARDEASLQRAVDEIQREGGEAIYVVADVADREAVQQIAARALETFGGFDTWINNAGVAIFGRIEEVALEDARRLFDVDYWGVVHGSLTAVEQLKARGGALINVGSVVSDRAIPLQGHYSAAKHAVKGFTEALRMELEEEEAPISVTLVKPSSIATPYPQHARNYMNEEPTLPPPVYAPEVVARAILACAQRPVRDVTVGAGGWSLARTGNLAPRLMDWYMETGVVDQQKKDRAETNGHSNLYAPVPGSGRERGDYDRHIMESSLYTRAVMNPAKTLLAALATGIALAVATRLRS